MRFRSALLLVPILGVTLAAQTPQLIDRQRVIDAINAVPAVPPVREICGNNIDDDGDTAVDEGCPPPIPACGFALQASSVQAPAQTSIGTVGLTVAPAGCAPNTWTASSAASWLTVTAAGAGSAAVTFTVASNSSEAARTGVLTIAGQAFTVTQAGVPPPPPPPPPGGCNRSATGIVFLDCFEYDVSRSDPTAAQRFIAQGWSGAKTSQSAPGARGYVYTTTSVPGYTGAFPGAGSRVLALEALPQTLGGQTDFYLQLGGSGSQWANYIPGDVWIQFWAYPLRDAAHPSRWGTRDKFLYACNTDYPCHSHLWMGMLGSYTYNPANAFPLGNPTNGGALLVTRAADGVSQIINDVGDPDARGNIGQNPIEWLRPNRWTLVKMRYNTTRTSGNSWEVWLKPLGGSWTKVSEWIGGVTPGFTWNIPAANVGGHRVLRMPTTVDNNFWLYLDDYVIARTEAALPIY